MDDKEENQKQQSFRITLPGKFTEGVAILIAVVALITAFCTSGSPTRTTPTPLVLITQGPSLPLTSSARPPTQATAQPTPTIPAGMVRGRVLWNEQPVEGATVYVTDEFSFDSIRYGSATTGWGGYFSIARIPEGDQYLYVFGNDLAFRIAVVTPVQMVEGIGTMAEDIYLCKGFDLISPRPGEDVHTSQPVLKWNAYPAAVDYAVRVDREGESGFVFQRGDFDERIVEPSVKVTKNLSPGKYRWRVDGFNAAGHIIICSWYPRSFEVLD